MQPINERRSGLARNCKKCAAEVSRKWEKKQRQRIGQRYKRTKIKKDKDKKGQIDKRTNRIKGQRDKRTNWMKGQRTLRKKRG